MHVEPHYNNSDLGDRSLRIPVLFALFDDASVCVSGLTTLEPWNISDFISDLGVRSLRIPVFFALFDDASVCV